MDRKEIKELAKSKIKGNLWNILWPLLLICVIEMIGNYLISGKGAYDINYEMTASSSILLIVFSLLLIIIGAGYTKYIINFVRSGKFDTNDIINTCKDKWLNILIASILSSIIIFGCSLLLIIPGIIMAFAYSFVLYLVVDSDVSAVDSLKESRAMMKGYKLDYFVFGLSFFGWIFLSIWTFGILFIWVLPYIVVATAIYYDRLKEKTK